MFSSISATVFLYAAAAPTAAPQPTLTAQDLQRMSEEEINRNWQTVKQALRAAR